jgi:hypothetical protein
MRWETQGLLVGEVATSSERILIKEGGSMTVAQRISLLLMLVSLLGCSSHIQHAQTPEPVAEKGQEEQQPKKTVMPTFTFRPGL